MSRYGCFEIRTTCSSCGESFPINGPFRKSSCTACFEEMAISPDIISGFLNDFEEEYEGLTNGQGRGGTLMSGSGTFKYGYWRLEPRCSSCKKPLLVPAKQDVSEVKCAECNILYHIFPIPDWLGKLVPSARLCYSLDPPAGEDRGKGVELDEESAKPIVMTCPQCAGAMSISTQSERMMECKYCGSEVYVPVAVWQRLHPVRKTQEWFVSFQGKNNKQLQAERRLKDQKEEKNELALWRIKNAPKRARSKFRFPLKILLLFLAVVVVGSLIFALKGYSEKDVSKLFDRYGTFLIVPAVILIPIWFVVRATLSGQVGKGKQCKQAMAKLAEKHSWKHEAAEYRSTLGYIDTKYKGRDIEINPQDQLAIEVEIHDSPFYLKTEPPAYPHDGVQRFTSGDSEFDGLFPIRYATPELTERIEKSAEDARQVLSPVYWFLKRWRKKLGRLQIDWSDAAVHLSPGHVEVMDTGNRYLLPEDLEPLLEDMMILAAGIDAIASGREPELPVSEPETGLESNP